MLNWKQENSISSWDPDEFAMFQETSNELIQPELSKWDKFSLWQKFIKDVQQMHENSKIFEKLALEQDLRGDKVYEFRENLEKTSREIQQKMPKYVLYDTFNLYNTPHDQMKIGHIRDDQKWWFDTMKDHLNDTYLKMLCQNNAIYSYISASTVLKKIFVAQSDPRKDQKQGVGPEGMSGVQMQSIMQQAQKSIQDQVQEMEAMNGAMGKGFDPAEMTFSDMEQVLALWEELKHYPMNNEAVTKFVKTTLKLSESYFSTQYTENEVEVIETDMIDDLQGLENLIDPLDKVHLDDLITHERKYHMKFDVYIDLSGSMGGAAMYRKGTNFNKAQLAKITALKLKLGNHVEDIYAYDTRLYGPFNSLTEFLRSHLGGGTTTDECLANILKTGRPGLIITDAQDSVSIYTELAYFVGISGSNFGFYSHSGSGIKFLDNKQCILHHPKKNIFIRASRHVTGIKKTSF